MYTSCNLYHLLLVIDPHRSVGDVVRHLCTNLCEESFDMVVRRSRILADALRRMERLTFDPKKKLNVSSIIYYCILLLKCM